MSQDIRIVQHFKPKANHKSHQIPHLPQVTNHLSLAYHTHQKPTTEDAIVTSFNLLGNFIELFKMAAIV